MLSRSRHLRALFAWGLAGLVLPAAAPAAIFTTTQSGISQIEVANIRVQENSDAKTNGIVSVFAIEGTLTTPEARTAARAGAHEIAANAKIDDKQVYSQTDWTTVLSQASYAIQLSPDNIFVNNAALDFLVPPSYLEITNNAEFASNVLATVLLADLRACFAIACVPSDAVFHLQANLDASYNGYSWHSSPIGDPSLDLTQYSNPTITDTGQMNFLRTVHIGFAAFQGHLDLGTIPANSPFTIEYVLQARVSGRGTGNVAIAAINDPFLLSTDPVQTGDPATLTLTAVPAPASGLLLLTGFGLAALRRKVRGP